MAQINLLSHLHALRMTRPLRRTIALAALLAGLLLLAGCAETGQMYDQPRYDPLEASTFFKDGMSARPIEPGTVAFLPNDSPTSPFWTGVDPSGDYYTGFPEQMTTDVVALGKARYDIYCIPCHGPTANGDGPVTTFGFPNPPDFHTDDAMYDLSNGEIFQVIENGTGQMFSYGYRVKPSERWAIIAYVRALQVKNGPVDPQTLTPADLQQMEQLGKPQ